MPVRQFGRRWLWRLISIPTFSSVPILKWVAPITADAIYAKIEKEEDFAAYHEKLKGKFVMTAPLRAVEAHFDAPGHRFTDQELADLAQQRPEQPPLDRSARERQIAQQQFNLKLLRFLTDQGAAAWLEPAPHDGGTITVMDGGPRDPNEPVVLPRVAVAVEHYNRIVRTLQKNIPVTL